MESLYKTTYIKRVVCVALAILFMCCFIMQPFTIKTKAIMWEVIAAETIASICFSVAASLGVGLVCESADFLYRNWRTFTDGMTSNIDKYTAVYNNGILTLSDYMYNLVYHFLDEYKNSDDIKLVESSYISKVNINGHQDDVYDFDTLEHAKEYIEQNKSNFHHLTSGTYGWGSSFNYSFILFSERGSHTNRLAVNNPRLIFSQNEIYEINYSGDFPYECDYSDCYYFFTIGKTCYLYLYSKYSQNSDEREVFLSSVDNPCLTAWVKGYDTALYGPLAPPITDDEESGKSVYIPLPTDTMNGVSVGTGSDVNATSQQVTDLKDSLSNPAKAGTADGTKVAEGSAVNDITATMDSSIVTSSEYGISGLQDIFPFCIPFDIYSMFSSLAAEREAPKITIHLDNSYVPFFDDNWSYDFVLDFSPFNTVAAILRTLETLAFIIGLAFLTHKLRGGGS